LESFIFDLKDYQKEIKPNYLFLAEGADEASLINVVLKDMAHDVTCAIVDMMGEKNTRSVLNLASGQDFFNTLSGIYIMRDANLSPNDVRQSILNAVSAVTHFPHQIRKAVNDIIIDGGLKTGFFVTPGKGNKGSLEDMIIDEINSNISIKPCIKEFEKCFNKAGKKRLSKKAQVKIYIASLMHGTGCTPKVGFEKGTLDFKHDAYAHLRQHINDFLSKN